MINYTLIPPFSRVIILSLKKNHLRIINESLIELKYQVYFVQNSPHIKMSSVSFVERKKKRKGYLIIKTYYFFFTSYLIFIQLINLIIMSRIIYERVTYKFTNHLVKIGALPIRKFQDYCKRLMRNFDARRFNKAPYNRGTWKCLYRYIYIYMSYTKCFRLKCLAQRLHRTWLHLERLREVNIYVREKRVKFKVNGKKMIDR